jgi:hypothetical protein
MILLLLSICIHIIVKYLLLLLVLILLLHLVSGGATPDSHQVVLLVVVALGLIVLHLEQVIVLLLRIAIGGVRDHRLSLRGLLLLLLDHVETLTLGTRGLQGRQFIHGSPHVVLDGLLLGGEGGVLLREFVSLRDLTSHLWWVVTMNNGILLKVEKIVILFGVNEVAIILFDDRLLMITLDFIWGGMHLIVDESLPLKEVLPPLLLLDQLLRLAIALL